jgi:hypothetical protein
VEAKIESEFEDSPVLDGADISKRTHSLTSVSLLSYNNNFNNNNNNMIIIKLYFRTCPKVQWAKCCRLMRRVTPILTSPDPSASNGCVSLEIHPCVSLPHVLSPSATPPLCGVACPACKRMCSLAKMCSLTRMCSLSVV